MDTISDQRAFGGRQLVLRHKAETTACDMTFSVFTPPQKGPRPAVMYLSGLTCSHANCTEKGGFQRIAADLGLIVICPDTSPRGEGVADDEGYDLGQGAGFYVDATEAPWAPHFQMESYITRELPELVRGAFDISAMGVFGHSMGGHGALTLAMRHPGLFGSVSAFAPIVSPLNCPWGEKAMTAYLGADRKAWEGHDACALVKARGFEGEILVDQGMADNFLAGELKTHLFQQACAEAGQAATIRMQAGYDHSYYFIASFMEDHLRHHAAALAG
ncbi:S-formylglutathione hydrolase [Rhodovulum sp. DZ06]|uniref:S-formylglutathione hydrolase n=1 Tax=Rhodovulum sp. DZ06 TaxID=3425126 RepID=UPI003D3447F6